MQKLKLAIITTHPIQYYAPVFRLLHQSPDVKICVFYTWGEQAQEKFDPGFGKIINWDIPVLNSYPYQWVKNASQSPGSHSFKGIINPDLISQVQAWQADAVLVYGWAYSGHLKALRYFKNRIPVYFRGDSTLLNDKHGLRSILRSLILNWVYSHINHAFYTGTNNKAYFKKYGLKDEQLSFAPHAIDNERFAIDRTTEAAQLRQSLNINADDLVILFAGKFEQKKSPELLLDAFLALNIPGVHLLFVGNGVMEIHLKTRASRHNNNVHFLDFKNQSFMPVVYQTCDLFCLPSKGPGETWGLAVNEAMAAGKAVLVSDKCGCAIDLVIRGQTGRVFEAGNLADLKNKLSLLLADKSALKTMGNNSANKIAGWSFASQSSAILNIINKTNAG